MSAGLRWLQEALVMNFGVLLYEACFKAVPEEDQRGGKNAEKRRKQLGCAISQK